MVRSQDIDNKRYKVRTKVFTCLYVVFCRKEKTLSSFSVLHHYGYEQNLPRSHGFSLRREKPWERGWNKTASARQNVQFR